MKPRSLTPLCRIPRSSSRSTAWENVARETDNAMFYLIGTFYPLLTRATYPTLGFAQYAGEVGTSEAGDVEAALALVERLDLDRYHYLHATRAELLRRLDRVDEARAAYKRALELVHSDAERRFLERRLAEL